MVVENVTETVGQYLKRKREEKNISVEEVTLNTRILPAFVHAMEEDRFDKIASLVSIRGFVRSYLRFLKLDETEGLRRLSESLSSSASRSDSTSPESHENLPHFSEGEALGEFTPADKWLDLGSVGARMRVAPRYYAWMGVLILSLASVLLIKMFFVGDQKSQAQHAPEQVQTDLPASPAILPPDEAVVSADPDAASAVPEVSSGSTGLPSQSKPFILSLEARDSTWVKVLTDGKITKDVLLQPGDKAIWQADATFLLTMGNGGGAEVFLDGKGLGFLGKKGEIVRDRLLTRVAEEAETDNE